VASSVSCTFGAAFDGFGHLSMTSSSCFASCE
jgi:hypothetical protein